jgi:hypothetical protein
MNSIEKNNTWGLDDLLFGKKATTTKWVFKLQIQVYGTIAKLKFN